MPKREGTDRSEWNDGMNELRSSFYSSPWDNSPHHMQSQKERGIPAGATCSCMNIMLIQLFSDRFSCLQFWGVSPQEQNTWAWKSSADDLVSSHELWMHLSKLGFPAGFFCETSWFLRPSNSPTGPGAERARGEECPGQKTIQNASCLTCHDPLPQYRGCTTSHVQRCRTDILLTLASSPDVCKKHTMQPSFLQRRQRPQIVRFK